MLYCDAAGHVYASTINRSVYDAARATTAERMLSSQACATVGIETTPGNFLPAVVEINEHELWALEHTVEHALRTGRLPDILKRYLKSIITRGAARREAVIRDFQRNKSKALTPTPKVLNRLPYYREHDMEISMPIYKARYNYPLILLKLLPGKNGGKSQQNLLVLDSDGDLAEIKVPAGLVKDVKKRLAADNKSGKKQHMCAVIYQQGRIRTIDFLVISQGQKKALDTITDYHGATGSGKHTVPAAARTVINLAGKRMTPEVR